MKSIILFSFLILGFFSVITVIARPDIVQEKYQALRAPILQYLQEKDAQVWKEEKDTERASWMIKLQLPKDCNPSKTALREIECKNLIQQHAQSFEQNWRYKIKNGWKPTAIKNQM